MALRLHQCSEVWIDQCHIHHTGAVCLKESRTARTRATFLARNHLHHGGGHGEGMLSRRRPRQVHHRARASSPEPSRLHPAHRGRRDRGEARLWGNRSQTASTAPALHHRALALPSFVSSHRAQSLPLLGGTSHGVGQAIVRNNVAHRLKGSGFASTDPETVAEPPSHHKHHHQHQRCLQGGSPECPRGMVLYLLPRKSAVNHQKAKKRHLTGNVVLGDAPKQASRSQPGGLREPDLGRRKHDATPTADSFDRARMRNASLPV